MGYKITVATSRDGKEWKRTSSHYLEDGKELTVGRADGNNIQTLDPRLSRKHGKLYVNSDGKVHYINTGQVGSGYFKGYGKMTRLLGPDEETPMELKQFITLQGDRRLYALVLSEDEIAGFEEGDMIEITDNRGESKVINIFDDDKPEKLQNSQPVDIDEDAEIAAAIETHKDELPPLPVDGDESIIYPVGGSSPKKGPKKQDK